MERKGGRKRSDRPRPRTGGVDLVAQRKRLLEAFFEDGRQLAGQIVGELDAAKRQLKELEAENARLRHQVKSNEVVRDFMAKMEALEAEREALLSSRRQVEEELRSHEDRVRAIEEELSNLAGLYVASSQLHASMEVRDVIRTMGELLAQFLGAGAYAVYLADGEALVPAHSEGIAPDLLRHERVGEGSIGSCFLAGDVVVREPARRRHENEPIAAVPLRVGDQPIGAVAVFELLEQKDALVPGDVELLRMLASQGATALAGARLYAAASGAIPKLPRGGYARAAQDE